MSKLLSQYWKSPIMNRLRFMYLYWKKCWMPKKFYWGHVFYIFKGEISSKLKF